MFALYQMTGRNQYFGRGGALGACHNPRINGVRLIWVAGVTALCVLCAGALIAFASTGDEGGGKPRLSSLEARLTGSGSSVVVTGYVRGAKDVLTRYKRDCRVLGLDSSDRREGLQFRLQVPFHGSARRERRCKVAISRRPLGPAGSGSSTAKRGPVQVIACADGLCVNRWLALHRVPSA